MPRTLSALLLVLLVLASAPFAAAEEPPAAPPGDPAGTYVLDVEYLRQRTERMLGHIVEGMTPEAKAANLEATLAEGRKMNPSVVLATDGTYVLRITALAEGGLPERAVEWKGPWKLEANKLLLTVTHQNGILLDTPSVKTLPYDGSTILIMSGKNIRVMRAPAAGTPAPAPTAGPPHTAPAPATVPAPAPAPAPAPTGPTWDTSKLEAEGFKILRTGFDAARNAQYWLLEETKDKPDYPIIGATFYDSDEVEIQSAIGSLEPSRVEKGARLRLFIPLPPASTLERAVKAVIKRRN